MPRLTPLPVTISLTLMTSVATHAEPVGTRTCTRWTAGREQHLSTTMETWVAGYVASSNQLGLGIRAGGGASACSRAVEVNRSKLQIGSRRTPRMRRF